MRIFTETYPDFQKVQHPVAFLPWRNNLTLMAKARDETERRWYIEQTLENGWNNTVLTHQIEMKLYQRQALTEKTDALSDPSINRKGGLRPHYYFRV